ncbi:hypothetical protein LJC59_01075, partial [Desulfovibrio sp. OttesenSCG-928-A18]|nr:hypothetical protein [Desulfovibrio sp. OttesenSCG-928-A18]
MDQYYWKIDTGAIYGSAELAWVTSIPDWAVVTDLMMDGPDGGKVPADLDFLRKTVAFYGLPTGQCLLPLEELRTAKLAEINAGYESVMSYVQAGYPLTEVLSWERQATQARELQSDPDADALFVRALAATKGVDVPEMTRRILSNAESWEPVAAMLTAQRQLMEEAVFAAQG